MTDETTDRHSKVRETITVVVLSLTAVLTAWSGSNSSRVFGSPTTSTSRSGSGRQ